MALSKEQKFTSKPAFRSRTSTSAPVNLGNLCNIHLQCGGKNLSDGELRNESGNADPKKPLSINGNIILVHLPPKRGPMHPQCLCRLSQMKLLLFQGL